MRTGQLSAFLAVVAISFSSAAADPPFVNAGGVVNAASGTAGAGIAQGSAFSIFGTDLGPATGVSAAPPYPTRLPSSSGASVTISSGGSTFAAFITFAGALQINAIMPSSVPVGPATLTVTFEGQASPPRSINVVSEQVGLYTENGQGWGQSASQLFPTYANNNLSAPAIPGQIMMLYGTGLGPLPSGLSDGQPIPAGTPAVNFLKPPYNYTVAVNVNGQMIPALFAGRTFQYPALDQINFTLPASVPTGCFVRAEVIVQTGGASQTSSSQTSNAFTIATAPPGGSCPNMFSLDQSALTKLQTGGTVNLGIAVLENLIDLSAVASGQSSPGAAGTPKSSAGALFVSANKAAVYGLDSLLTMSGLPTGAVWDPSLLPPSGQCALSDEPMYSLAPANALGNVLQSVSGVLTSQMFLTMFPGAVLQEMSAGSQLLLFGQGGSVPLVPTNGPLLNLYSTDPAAGSLYFISGGQWALWAPGDAEGNRSFTVPFTVPRPLVWTNLPAKAMIPGDSALVMQWESATASQSIAGAALNASGSGEVFVCTPPDSVGQFTVPQDIVQSLPPAVSNDTRVQSLAVTTTETVPLGTVKGLDGGAILFSAGSRITATWGNPESRRTLTATSGTPQSTPAGKAFPAPLVVTVDEANGSPVAGVLVTFTAPASGPGGTFAHGVKTAVTNAQGVATAAVFTANAVSGSYQVTASITGDAATAVFSLTNTAGSPASIAASSGTPQSATVNTAFAAPLAATVLDASGNPVAGVTVTFSAPSSGAGGAFAAGGNTAVTDAHGVAVSGVFTADATTGSYSVMATVAGVATPAAFALTNTPGPTITVYSGSGQSATIHTAFAAPLAALVRDASGSPIVGAPVAFAAPASGPGGVFTQGINTVTTNAQGVATSPVFTANAIAGTYNVTASVATAAAPATFVLTNTAGPPASIAATGGTPQSAKTGVAFAAPLAATVTDAGGNPVSGVTVAFTAPTSGASGSFAGGVNTAVTNVQGIASSAVFSANNTAGSYVVSAAASGVSGSAAFSLTNTAVAPASIAVASGTPQSAKIYTAFPAPLAVTVKDAAGNPVSGVVVNFTAPSSGASGMFAGGIATATTNAQGAATSAVFTANGAAGVYSVTAAVSGVSQPATFTLTNTAGAAASITAAGGTPQTATIATAFATPLSATVKDAGGNPVGGVTVTFSAPVSGASGTFAGGVSTATTSSHGVAVSAVFLANRTAGTYHVTAAVSGVSAQASFILTNNPGAPANVAATSGSGQSAAVNSTFVNPLVATVTDAGGNGVPGATVTFTAPPQSGASVVFVGGVNNATTNAAGIATSAALTANGNAGGPYNVVASSGTATSAGFALTNTSGAGTGTITVSNATVGANLEEPVTVTLDPSPPDAGVVVTITSTDPARLLVGTAQPSFSTAITPGLNPFTTPIQALAASGSATITVSAPGYRTATATIALAPSGFVIAGPNGIGGAFSTFGGVSTPLTVSAGRLDSNGALAEVQQVRSGYSVSVPLSSSDVTVGAVPTAVAFNGGDSSAVVSFTASATKTGMTTVTAGAPAGFNAPTSGNTLAVTVQQTGPMPFAVTVGQNLQTDAVVSLSGPTPVSDTIALTSSDSGKLLFSTGSNTPGSPSITVTIPANSAISPSFFVQAIGPPGAVGYTVSSGHYGSVSGSVTIAPAGLAIQSPGGFGAPSFSAPLSAGPASIGVFTGRLDANGNFIESQSVAAGGSASVTLIDSNTSVGTVGASPLTISGGTDNAATTLQPLTAGTTTLTASSPGFAAAQVGVTVTAVLPPLLFTAGDANIGEFLESQYTVTLTQSAPAGGVQITVQSDSGQALLASGVNGAGAASIVLQVPAGANTAMFYVQALSGAGTANVTASAAGYAPATAQVQLAPSGVVIFPPSASGNAGGNAAGVSLYVVWLDSSGAPQSSAEVLSGSQALPISLSNSAPSVASAPATVSIPAGSASAPVAITLSAAGSASVSVVQPPGFATPNANTSTEVTVN